MFKEISWEGKRALPNKEVPLIEKYFKIIKREWIQNLLFFAYRSSIKVCSFFLDFYSVN